MVSATAMVDPELGELTDDVIAGEWRIWQRKRGHRFSVDDVLTAWEGARANPTAQRYLDLGCGIGSVLLMVSYKLKAGQVSGLEAQSISFEMVKRNVARNGLSGRVTLKHGDMRELALVRSFEDAPFDLITGTPPYFPPSNGTASPDSQRAHARMELRGGVEVYIDAASEVLAPGGRFVVCADARFPERVENRAKEKKLRVLQKREIIPRVGHRSRLFTVFTLGHEAEGGTRVDTPPFIVRDEAGVRTEAAKNLRRYFEIDDPSLRESAAEAGDD